MVVFAGQGDARRSMALLWRADAPADGAEKQAPGPKPGLSVDDIVSAGIEVADAEGMAGLSMRAVGERLGRTAMALYTYVPSKNELLDLMFDQTLAELPAEYDLGGGWRAALTAWAEEAVEFNVRHPWVLQVSEARPVLGPNEFVVLESILRILHETGLGSAEVRGAVSALSHFVRGAAQVIADARTAAKTTGVSDNDWWFSRSPLLDEVSPDFADRFPMIAKLETENPVEENGLPPEDTPYMELAARKTFAVGLTLQLDGIAAAIAKRT
ncbi:TetR/AcrR family transcriptional regulator [Amycolatopsis minnesotensis]|uniref:TetR/AcrR family transcriptional regulator C-terminal domain-containing protein n=1 Tax=Amycolatopsis minnesotensis TaxID=337894 RepID=A0ABP5BKV0_9PSEU